jgi:hypothetical protein
MSQVSAKEQEQLAREIAIGMMVPPESIIPPGGFKDIEEHTVPGPSVALYLTPRHALQTLGTDWGRACYGDVWVAYAMRVAQKRLEGACLYTPAEGLIVPTDRDTQDRDYVPWGSSIKGVVFNDMRFKNEFEYVKKNGGKVIRVRRPVDKITISAAHQSENDLNDIPDDAFDYVIHGQPNNVLDLAARTDEMLELL